MFSAIHSRSQAARGDSITRRLIIRPGAIGDCILSFPALEYLKADYTELWISSPLVPLIQFADCVRSIASTQLDLVIGDQFPTALKSKLHEFDEVVSWYGTNRPEFRAALDAVHPRCTFLPALPCPDWHEHASDFFLHQVGGCKGATAQIDIEAIDLRRTVVIHPFSGSLRKNWPLDQYRSLASQLGSIEWTAGPEEALDGAIRFTNLFELGRWIKGAAVYLGNDSGVSHLAAAVGVPSVVLFGPTNSAVWAPRGKNVNVIQHLPLKELGIEPVLHAVLDYL